MAAGGTVLSAKLQKRFRNELFSTLLYYQLLIHAFGFYGIWGQVLIKVFLSEYVQPGILSRITDTSLLLGLPFALFAWLMLIQFANSASGRKRNKIFIPLFLLINAALLITIGYTTATYQEPKPAIVMKNYYIFMNSFYTLSASALLYFNGRSAAIPESSRRKMAVAIILIAIIQTLPLILYSSQAYLALLFITLFFLGNVFLPVWLYYRTNLDTFTSPAGQEENPSFESFCEKYDVSPRESEIIREICNGLSNKEISEKLFISLQTVKDHTHRIYIKTNVRSRAQLMNLMRDIC
ncbi:MAG: LuxR C-terminal-related transcriptional regulator [Bacteroidales bacterium]|jgi:DNA-binding CsgD family transcriptional regulator|nr:LuxR C-terminal-related transcriptional regulator [Bacteroidales bacterium]